MQVWWTELTSGHKLTVERNPLYLPQKVNEGNQTALDFNHRVCSGQGRSHYLLYDFILSSKVIIILSLDISAQIQKVFHPAMWRGVFWLKSLHNTSPQQGTLQCPCVARIVSPQKWTPDWQLLSFLAATETCTSNDTWNATCSLLVFSNLQNMEKIHG